MPPFEMTPDNLTALAERYAPVLRFQADERFFPTGADFWLQIRHSARWSPGPRRGTAIMTGALGATVFDASHARGGSFDGNSPHRIELSRGTDPDQIGNSSYNAVGAAAEDLFLDVAGWLSGEHGESTVDFTRGDEWYLLGLTLPLARAMGARLYLRPRPTLEREVSAATIPRDPVPPVLYAEVEWLGKVRARAAEIEAPGYMAARDESVPVRPVLGPLATQNERLNLYFGVTYHALFPALELSDSIRGRDPAADVLHREGQWVALSLLFRAEETLQPDPASGRPAEFDFETLSDPVDGRQFPIPSWVVYASGYARPSEDRPAFVARRWDDSRVSKVNDTHVEAFVTSGTHKLQPEPQLGRRVTVRTATPVSDAFTVATAATLAASTGFALAAAAVGGTVPIAISTGPGVVAVVLADAVLITIAGIFFLISLVLGIIASIARAIEGSPRTRSELTISPTQDVDADLASGDGPAAVPGGVSVGPSQTGVGSPAGPGDRPTAASETAISLALVNRFGDPAHIPPWWDYTGRWGIQVARSPMRSWRSGSYLRDREGRTPLYWAVAEAAREAGGSL